MTSWSHDKAEPFVLALFAHVARNDAPKPEWVQAWTERALRLGSAEATFLAFIETPGHQKRIEDDRDARTRWPAGHAYSPIPSRRELERDAPRLFAPRALPGVDLRAEEQLRLLAALAPFFATIPFPDTHTPPFRYFFKNSGYGFGDALIYWAMLNHLRPARILEIGGGFASALALDTIARLNLETTCTFVTPDPDAAQQAIGPLDPAHRLIKSRAQDLDPAQFEKLEAGDLLFINSTHVLKAGSDVHFLLTEALPRLRPGVFVHFQEIFAPFEYPRSWVIDRGHGWNEAYALHLFLQYNAEFQIEFFNHYIGTELAGAVTASGTPQMDRFLLNPGGGLWLSRRSTAPVDHTVFS